MAEAETRPAPSGAAAAARPVLLGREAAEGFVGALIATMASLEAVLVRETDSLAAGRIREGLALEAEKSGLAACYLRDLEVLKANAVALARFAPEAIARLRQAHAAFRTAVDRNQTVVATAKSVSEGLVRSLSEEMSRRSRPTSYGSAATAGRPAAGQPLVFSARM